MASWLPHNKFAVAAEPVSAVNENVADKLRRYIKPRGNVGHGVRRYRGKRESFRSVGSHEIVLHGTRLVPDEGEPGGCNKSQTGYYTPQAYKVRRYRADRSFT